VTYRNPILPGFYPDPSVCRVGNDFYLVTSTFEYFPGVPIFHSTDLTNWRQIGHVLTRKSQLSLDGLNSSQGIFAPTLRYHAGTFYLITTNVGGGGNFYVTANDPAGPWSEPIWVREPPGGVDPSLLFDDDGRVYYTKQGGGERGAIHQAEIDVASGALKSELVQVWSGTGGVWPEGPHLYKVRGVYYLMIAEGGTGYEHSVTVARSASPSGPFEAFADNPILTHRHRHGHPIQATGHADLVELPNGTWWLVFLGIRPWRRGNHHLGRETFLAPVTWSTSGWPVVHHGAAIELHMDGRGLPAAQAAVARKSRDDFDSSELALEWNFVRNPRAESFSLTERRGHLRLKGSQLGLDAVGAPAFVGRRQQHYRVAVESRMTFEPTLSAEEAGLCVRMNEDNHFALAIRGSRDGRRVQVRTRIQGHVELVADEPILEGPVTLRIEAGEEQYEFFYVADGAERRSLGTAPSAPLASEVAGGFTGVYLGMYAATSRDTPMPPADFDWFEYAPLD
jgi:xylan 1,4-beta-xylosidase